MKSIKFLSGGLMGAAALTLALAGGQAMATDLAAGKAAYEKFACASCHGADAKTAAMATYPILAGQHEDYLLHALRAYKRGAAGGGAMNARNNAVMTAMVQQLSEADMRNIAGWLASLPSDLAVRR